MSENSSTAGGAPLVGIVVGSKSDWGVMEHAAATLARLAIPHEARVLSAHRSPEAVREYALAAEKRGLRVIIAGAGMAAHLAGFIAGQTPLPVLGVPMESPQLKGLDSLLSTVQMPGGVPVATFAIGKAGAVNAAVFAAQILALSDARTKAALADFRAEQTAQVLATTLP
ncbi:MAG: 5-(carboxyamino)imidazole ribonucleotide mutase [Puniceicoccales bacterium]|jgi:5-(carboxyamino)imidazole ribonucleotide mutase|nr:5-(carboxyamino)imidazole ribonucleotide mutase [Puniceicoccales bacterium]